MKILMLLYVCAVLLLPSCKKDLTIGPYSILSVRFIEDEEYIFIKTPEASWDFNGSTAKLYARGYKFEQFNLHLSALQTTGFYPTPTIQNISYTDGLDFIPFKVSGGFINITYLDSLTVKGIFQVSLEDNFNGAENRTITGGFGINIYP
jgi:hypothetical protein